MPAVDPVRSDIDDEAVLGQPLFRVGCRLGLVFDYEDAHGRKKEKGAGTSAPSHSTPRSTRRSVAEAAVFQRGRDVDAHAVVDGALRGDLLQIEGLRHAVELPGEFLAVRDELHDFT